MKFKFDTPLTEGKIIRGNSQFTLDVEINGNIEKVHCPTTGRIGNIDLKNVAGLLFANFIDGKSNLDYTKQIL